MVQGAVQGRVTARYWTSIANLHVAAASLGGAALRGGSEFEVTSACHRAAAAAIAHDLACCLRLSVSLRSSWADVGARSTPSSTARGLVSISASGRRSSAAFLAFVVIIEKRTCGANDPAAAFANGLEAVFADKWADARGLQPDLVKRAECRELGVELRAGVLVE